ncbi:hypothetical protein BGZ61DRAFT_531595 [Ilyonectria robusta]|uniref:uncharacterized protein n=1 Tax=Ilyonectria robusta TaxID=1079257 RepID=UPI001E8DADC5|nr:uncharacterized protein BGZ61DRAFT_531595 [Ilyonectria robusta]KAH8706402.1 hypothetical protein BGZ61DRAFT_531595 [Ilyonectria robusta]
MGIKGIYGEIGRGTRVSLSRLAADSFVNEGRPLRLAVDIAIWQFQTQAARGGTNPAIRTLFYRLTRLLATPIEPIFVFDGPNKPVFKRNKRSGRGDGVATAQAKRLIRLFGFTIHDAPGEAEAECALLQQHGIVDAVLSEDVDTIMFGCTRTLRNWSAEGKGSKTPTHVSLYDVESMNIRELGLGREGMVLVALMSGGDYLPDGIPGCGVKVACEAAKAGFGKSICRLKASDKAGIQAWRESLVHELRTNEKGFFRTKHKALMIPEDFPNLEVLRYYTHPVVSPEANLDAVRDKFSRKQDLYLEDLREFTRETFDWDFRIGAIKFIRVLGQALLVKNILQQPEGSHVQRITGSRSHFSTDSTRELRLSYVPQDMVPIDLSKEVDEEIASGRGGLALNSDDEFEAPVDGMETNGSKAIVGKIYDPAKPDLAWVLEAVARHSVPAAVEEWEAAESAKAAKKAPAKKKLTNSKSKAASGMPSGSLDKFVQVTKLGSKDTAVLKVTKKDTGPAKPSISSPTRASTSRRLRVPSPLEPSKHSTPEATAILARQKTPWTLASSQATPRTRGPQGAQQAIIIPSSPPSPAYSVSPSSPRQPRSRQSPFRSTLELPESVRSILSSGYPAKGVRNERQKLSDVKTAEKSASLRGSQPTKMKQSSMDMFATKTARPSASQPVMPKPSTTRPVKEKAASLPITNFDDSDDFSGFESDSSDLEPLSSLISRASASPGKRRKEILSNTRSPSPGPAPVRKKKLLVPRTSAVGFFKEIEVDSDEHEDCIAREAASLQRKGNRGRVARMSEVEIVDLTQDD